ncbi:MAG: hypothetical protein HQ508_03090 [Candidatus Marinimicrobia bacterium]|nr:hypothetical protein [Candidatus Neomarinimicrobiota bacterium]
MRLSQLIIIVTMTLFASCSRETADKVEIGDPGFGIVASSVDSRIEGVDIPVLLKSADVIKGIQFTLSWDPEIGQVIEPKLTEMNPGFTVSSNVGAEGQMKVLVFSMTSDVLITSEPELMTIPVRIIDHDAETFNLWFKDVIFAGPNSTSYNIPITHAKLQIKR